MVDSALVSPKGVVGLETVIYGVEDVAKSTKFFTDYGFDPIEASKSGSTLLTPEKTTIAIRDMHDEALPNPIQDGSTVRETIWGIDTQANLDALTADIESRLPVTRDADGTVHTVDPMGNGIGLRVTERVPVRLEPISYNAAGEATRINARAPVYHEAAPQHLGHIVFMTDNFDATVDFYTETLGFWVSDYIDGLGIFLRCSSDHHNLFLINSDHNAINHISCGVSGVDEIMGGYEKMTAEGWDPIWGLGRHLIGSNMFYYFRNPSGGFIEYYADLDCIMDATKWEPGHFDPSSPDALAVWGGLPPQAFFET